MKLIVNFISYNSVCLHFSPKPLLKKKLSFLFNDMDHVTHPFSFADIRIIYQKAANFAISRNADIGSIQVHNSSNFSWVSKDCFNKRGQNFDDASKNGFLRPS